MHTVLVDAYKVGWTQLFGAYCWTHAVDAGGWQVDWEGLKQRCGDKAPLHTTALSTIVATATHANLSDSFNLSWQTVNPKNHNRHNKAWAGSQVCSSGSSTGIAAELYALVLQRWYWHRLSAVCTCATALGRVSTQCCVHLYYSTGTGIDSVLSPHFCLC